MRRLFLGLLLVGALTHSAQAAGVPAAAGDVNPRLIGADVAGGTFLDAGGAEVDASKLFGEMATVVIVYRGGW